MFRLMALRSGMILAEGQENFTQFGAQGVSSNSRRPTGEKVLGIAKPKHTIEKSSGL